MQLRLENLVLHPKVVFPLYPHCKSIPPMLQPPNKFCPCCPSKGFVARAAIFASCGCEFHPVCIVSLLQSGQFSCPNCNCSFTGAWMAQFGIPLTETMAKDLEIVKDQLQSMHTEDPPLSFPPDATPTLVELGYSPLLATPKTNQSIQAAIVQSQTVVAPNQPIGARWLQQEQQQTSDEGNTKEPMVVYNAVDVENTINNVICSSDCILVDITSSDNEE